MKPLSIAVTGANGGIGSRLIDILNAQGHNILALSRRRPLDPNVAWSPYSLSDRVAATAEKLHGIDLVVHLAATVPGPASGDQLEGCFWDHTVLGTQLLVDAMSQAKVGRLILAGAANIYKPDRAEADEDSPVGPQSRVLYLASKAAQEWIAASMCKEKAIGYAVMRISSVVGDGRSIIDRLASDLASGNTVRIDDGAAFGADFIDCEDVCRGLAMAVELDLNGAYNLSTGTRTELIDAVLDLTKMLDCPPGAIRMVHADRAPDTGFPAVSCDKLRSFGFEPRAIDVVLSNIADRAKSLAA